MYSQYRKIGRPSAQRKRGPETCPSPSSPSILPDTEQRPLPSPTTNPVPATLESVEDHPNSFLDSAEIASEYNIEETVGSLDDFGVGTHEVINERNDFGLLGLDRTINSAVPAAEAQAYQRSGENSTTILRTASQQSHLYDLASGLEDLFQSPTDYFSTDDNSCLPPLPAIESSLLSSHSVDLLPLVLEPGPVSAWSPSSNDESQLYRKHDMRCVLRCQTILTWQLGEFSEFQDSDSILAFDRLLALDARVRSSLHTVLSCGFCMDWSRCGQILLLSVIIISNLHQLFERGCGAVDGVFRSDLIKNPISNQRRSNHASLSGFSPPSTGDKHRVHSNTPWQESSSDFDANYRHLLIGEIRVDEGTKEAFQHLLLHIYLNRQQHHVQQVEKLLNGMEIKNVNCKVAQDLIKNIKDKLDIFRGFLSLMNTS